MVTERKEAESNMADKEGDKKPEKKKKKKLEDNYLKEKKKKKKQDKTVSEVISEVRDASEDSDLEEDGDDFWMPLEGDRWDNDDGGNRWGSTSESEPENDEIDGEGISLHPTSHDF